MKYKCFCHRDDFNDLTKEELMMMLRTLNRFTLEEFIMHYQIGEKDFHILMTNSRMNPLSANKIYQNVKEVVAPLFYISDEVRKSYKLQAPINKIIMRSKQNKFKKRKPIPKSILKEVYEMYDGRCDICGTKEDIIVHHITYVSEGGTNEPSNLRLLCAEHHAEIHNGERIYGMLKSIALKRKRAIQYKRGVIT